MMSLILLDELLKTLFELSRFIKKIKPLFSNKADPTVCHQQEAGGSERSIRIIRQICGHNPNPAPAEDNPSRAACDTLEKIYEIYEI